MFSTKNFSPRELAAFTALIITVPTTLLILWLTGNWKVALGSLIVLFVGSFALVHFILDYFIYRKIKLIYKLIHRTKASRKEEVYLKYILPKKSIDEVRQDVEDWAEKQQKEIDLLQKNESFRKEFLQNLAHEFKTPIFAIQGYLDTLLDGAMDDEAVRSRFLEKAVRNTTRLVNLVNDLDEITKLESGELFLYKTQFPIQELINEVYDSLSIKTSKKKIHTSIKKGCENPLYVFADKEKIKQVLINLISNSTKYGKENGTIVASIYLTDESQVLIEISDDGIGIEEEHLFRIFERFYRTDTARSRDVGGTGLGLAICKHIVEAHSGTIHARSKPDVGTTIGFTLPATRKEQ